MTFESIRVHRVPIGLGLLALALWLAAGIHRVEPSGGWAVLDSPLGLLVPRRIDPGWHLAPPGLARIALYPSGPATFTFEAGASSAAPALITREGIEVQLRATIRYSLDADHLVDLHRSFGPAYERTALTPWVAEALRDSIRSSSFSDISGAHTEDLRDTLGQKLADRFRGADLTLLSCDVDRVRINGGGPQGAHMPHPIAGMKVLLIGLDGADWNIIDPLVSAGKLPHLARLIRGGVRARLHTITPMLSPVVWTSIATGMLPGRHGIIDFLATNEADGSRVPVTSSLRKVKAIWNILGEQGLRVGVVGWWATFPAERVNGFIVSDRVAYQLFGGQPARDQSREGKVYPPDLDEVVLSLTIAPETLGVQEVSRYLRLDPDSVALPPEQSKLVDDFRTLLAAGDTYTRVGVALAGRIHPDFLAVYLEGTDTVAHLFMPYAPPPLEGVDRDAARRFGHAVEEYYRHADELVGRLLETAGRDTAVVICSDHGFRTGDNRPLTDSRIGVGQAADWHRKFGILILNGAPFRSGIELRESSVLDITPTILTLFGLPVAEDMDGRPLDGALTPEFLRDHPIRYIPTYEGAATRLAAGEPAGVAEPAAVRDPKGDAELKEKLQSLGYLSQDSANSHNNRGMLLLAKGDYDGAIGEFEKAIAASEDLGIARLNIARAQFKKKDYDAAVASIEEHLKRRPRSKEGENLLGNIAMERGQMADAEAHFRKALDYEPHFTDARNSLGILYDRLGRQEDALQQFNEVVKVDPDYAEAYNNIGVIRKKQGRLDDAIAAFRRAIAADAEFTGSYSNLALVLEEKGDQQGAEEQFRQALSREPKNVAVRTNYGGLLYAMGRLEDARRELERAVRDDPSYASAHNNLGAVYGRLGRPADEISAYRKAVTLDPHYADVHHNLGLALLKEGERDEGEAELRTALQIDPSYGPAYLNLAGSLLEHGDAVGAARLLGEGRKQLPGDSRIARLLGETMLQLHRTPEAIAALRDSLSLDPNQPEVSQKLQELTAAATRP
jgi:tetratricopeptide (TPR) repeat protein